MSAVWAACHSSSYLARTEGFTRPHGIRWLGDDRHDWVTAEFERSLLKVDIETGGSSSGGISVKTARTCSRSRPTASNSTPRTGAPTRSASSTPRRGGSSAIPRRGPGAEGIDVSPDGREIWTGFRRTNEVEIIAREGLRSRRVRCRVRWRKVPRKQYRSQK